MSFLGFEFKAIKRNSLDDHPLSQLYELFITWTWRTTQPPLFSLQPVLFFPPANEIPRNEISNNAHKTTKKHHILV